MSTVEGTAPEGTRPRATDWTGFWTNVGGGLVVGGGFGGLLALVGLKVGPGFLQLLLDGLDYAVRSAPAWVTLTLVLSVGIGAFRVRQRHPQIYGGAELFFGAITAALALQQFLAYHAGDPGAGALADDRVKSVFALFTGLYVVVRGLDNVGRYMTQKGVKDTTAGRLWGNYFGPKPDSVQAPAALTTGVPVGSPAASDQAKPRAPSTP